MSKAVHGDPKVDADFMELTTDIRNLCVGVKLRGCSEEVLNELQHSLDVAQAHVGRHYRRTIKQVLGGMKGANRRFNMKKEK